MGLDDAFEKSLALLPLATYRAGETILTEGSKSDRLLILKKGAVAIIKDSIEIARVEEYWRGARRNLCVVRPTAYCGRSGPRGSYSSI